MCRRSRDFPVPHRRLPRERRHDDGGLLQVVLAHALGVVGVGVPHTLVVRAEVLDGVETGQPASLNGTWSVVPMPSMMFRVAPRSLQRREPAIEDGLGFACSLPCRSRASCRCRDRRSGRRRVGPAPPACRSAARRRRARRAAPALRRSRAPRGWCAEGSAPSVRRMRIASMTATAPSALSVAPLPCATSRGARQPARPRRAARGRCPGSRRRRCSCSGPPRDSAPAAPRAATPVSPPRPAARARCTARRQRRSTAPHPARWRDYR